MKITIYKIFDFILICYIPIYAVFSQQAGPLAQYMMDLGTVCFLISGIFLILQRYKNVAIPYHFIWYMGFMGLIIGNSFITNTTIGIDISTLLRILSISFLITVRILNEADVLSIIKKLALCGISEVFFLLFAVSAASWKKALLSGGRLGIGEIELNVCAFLLSCSVMSCIIVWNITRQRKWLGICLCEMPVLILFQSRTGIFSLLIGIIFYFGITYGNNKILVNNVLVVLVAIGIGTIFVAMILKYTDYSLLRIFSYDDSIKYRLQIISASIDAWCERPIWGHGLSLIEDVMYQKMGYPFASHNNIAGLAVGTGAAGVIYYYTFFAIIIIKEHFSNRKCKLETATWTFLAMIIFSDLSCENYKILVSQIIIAISIAMIVALRKFENKGVQKFR